MNEPAIRSQWQKWISEGLVIVVSILLAFAIDALWDERQERIEEKEVLEALLVEFQLNRTEAADVIEAHQRGRQRVAELARMTTAEAAALRNNEADAILAALANPRTFDPLRGTVDSLIGAGKFDIIRDHQLRKALISFINRTEDAVEDAAYLIHWSTEIWIALDTQGGPWRAVEENLVGKKDLELGDLSFIPTVTGDDISRIRGDSDLMGLILRKQMHAAHYSSEIRRVAEKIDEILALLEAQLQ